MIFLPYPISYPRPLQLLKISGNNKVETYLTGCQGEEFIFPNDLTFGTDGNLYMTYRVPYCWNEGELNSYCYNLEEDKLVSYCYYGCENNGCIEEGEEDNHGNIHNQVYRLSTPQIRGQRCHPLRPGSCREADHGDRHQQN